MTFALKYELSKLLDGWVHVCEEDRWWKYKTMKNSSQSWD